MTNRNTQGGSPLPHRAELELLIERRVSERLDNDQTRRDAATWRRWAVLGSVLTLLGVSGLTWLPRRYVADEVEKQLTAANNNYQQLFESQTLYQEFFTLSLSAIGDRGELVRPQNLDRILAILAALKDRPQSLNDPPQAFDFHFQRFLGTLVDAGMHSRIEGVEELFRDTPLLLAPAALDLLAAHYGLRVVGSTTRLNPNSHQTERLRYYLNEASLRAGDEAALFWALLLHFRLAEEESTTSTHTAALKSLLARLEESPARDAISVRLFTFSRADRFMKQPSDEARKVAATVRSFLQENPAAAPPPPRVPESWAHAPPRIWTGRQSGNQMPSSDVYLQSELTKESAKGWEPLAQVDGRLGAGFLEVRHVYLTTPERLTDYVVVGACDALCLQLDLTIRGSARTYASDADAKGRLGTARRVSQSRLW